MHDRLTQQLIGEGLADSTVRAYTALYRRWEAWADDHGADPHELRPSDVRAWSHTVTSRAVLAQAAGMVKHTLLAQGREPHRAIRVPAAGRSLCRAIDHEDARHLARTADRLGTRGLSVLVAMFTGARRSEVASLAWERIGKDTITLQRPKNKDLHTIPLHPALAERLERLRVPGETWVFPGRYGGHVAPATIGEWFVEVAGKAGLGHVTQHQARHTALATVNDATHDLRATQQLAGHQSPLTTVRYTRASVTRLAAAVDALRYVA